ncbi:MAG: hypothetical protein JWQ95_4 [Sphaerisporangium sp.]|nr:hypothetical protein [Sphaerisporangium sp.]
MEIDARAGLVEQHTRWLLPVVDGTVTQIRVDYAFTLVMDHYSIRISTPFSLSRGDEHSRHDPEVPETLAPLLELHQATLREGVLMKDGLLVLSFHDGTTLTVLPDERYEAWEAVGELPPVTPSFKVIALPGGGLAVF